MQYGKSLATLCWLVEALPVISFRVYRTQCSQMLMRSTAGLTNALVNEAWPRIPDGSRWSLASVLSCPYVWSDSAGCMYIKMSLESACTWLRPMAVRTMHLKNFGFWQWPNAIESISVPQRSKIASAGHDKCAHALPSNTIIKLSIAWYQYKGFKRTLHRLYMLDFLHECIHDHMQPVPLKTHDRTGHDSRAQIF